MRLASEANSSQDLILLKAVPPELYVYKKMTTSILTLKKRERSLLPKPGEYK